MNEVPKKETIPERYQSVDYQKEVSEENARESIGAVSPQIHIKTIERVGGGIGSVAFMVNDEYIFRFPRHERADESLGVEMRLLPVLEKHMTLPIPHFEIMGKQAGSDLRFVGYKAIRGVQMERETLFDRTEHGQVLGPNRHLTEQIATFFREIHSFNVQTARDLGVPERSLKARMMGQILDAREYIFPLIQQKFPEQANRIIESTEIAFDDYLSDSGNFDYEPRLIHGDLEAEHIFVDPEKRTVTGFIDFGSMRIDDPDYDLWRPYSWFGREFMDLLLEQYPHKDPERLYKKMEFFWTAQEGQRAVRAIMINDENSANQTIRRIKERLF